MPSTLPWSSPQHGSLEVNSVYNGKRKAETETETTEEMQEIEGAKRRCYGAQEQGQGDHHMEDTDMEVAPQPHFVEGPQQTQSVREPVNKQTWISQRVCNQYPEPRSPSPWPSHPSLNQQPPIQQQPHQQQPPQSSELIMNINDETYGRVSDMGESMEDDFVPDQTQYFSPQKQPGPGGDIVATTSELARSYCRPSWDGLTGVLRPYVNDYY